MKASHISPDLLAAFLDGRATSEETLTVFDAIATDPELREVLRISLEVDRELGKDRDEGVHLAAARGCPGRE